MGAVPGMDGIMARIADLSRQEPTDAIMKQIKTLDDLRKKYAELADAKKGYEKRNPVPVKIRTCWPRKLRAWTSGRRRSGMKYPCGKRRKATNPPAWMKRTPPPWPGGMWGWNGSRSVRRPWVNDIIKQNGVKVGNGGKSLGMSSSILGATEKQTLTLKEIKEILDHWPPGQIVMAQ